MFNKPPKSNTPSKTKPQAAAPSSAKPAARAQRAVNAVPSILSQDLNIKGNIDTQGDVQIEGKLKGDVKASVLTVGENGQINGNIHADTVHVMGKINGRIEANTIDIQSTAHVTAEMVQQNLTIASGAYVDGQCIHSSAAANAKKKPLQDA